MQKNYDLRAPEAPADAVPKRQQGTRDVPASRAYLFCGLDSNDFTYGEVIVTRAAWLDSLKSISLDDLERLNGHRFPCVRVREITPIEVAKTGLPPDTIVSVAALPDGKLRRRFYLSRGYAAEVDDRS